MRLLFTALACLMSVSVVGQFNLKQIINASSMTKVDQEIYFLSNGYEYGNGGEGLLMRKSLKKESRLPWAMRFEIEYYQYPIDTLVVSSWDQDIRLTIDSLGDYYVYHEIDTIGVKEYDDSLTSGRHYTINKFTLNFKMEDRFDDFLGQVYKDLKTLNFSLIDQRNDYYEVSGILSLTKEYRRRSTPYNFDHARHPNSDGIEYIYINYHQDSFSGNWELILNYNKVTYDF